MGLATNNKRFWNKFFVIAYNILGIVGIHACFYGQNSILAADSLIFTERDFYQAIIVTMTILFFASSYLLLARLKAGIVIPAFLLSFIIAGGFVILTPILIGHVAYYMSPSMQADFS